MLVAPGVRAAGRNCITFSADASFGIIVVASESAPDVHLEYSTDGTEWSRVTIGQSFWAERENFGDKYKLHVCGKDNDSFSTIFKQDGRIVIGYNSFALADRSLAREIACSGDIESLLDYEHPTKAKGPAYAYLFQCFRELTEAPSLSANAVEPYGCYKMFQDCTSLRKAPQLPATKLSESCYVDMFKDCVSLKTAPSLPATTLADRCYAGMFERCTSLTSEPSLPATTLAAYCYNDMFSGCSSLTSAPSLPALTLTEGCYASMFSGCSSLTTPPQLSAATLAKGCCESMFSGCSALKTAPSLSATKLETYCYRGMFSGCTSLTAAPALPAAALAESCYKDMFDGCASLTTAPALPATDLTKWCYDGMFRGCTSLRKTPVSLPATNLFNECYVRMFEGCTSLTEAPQLPAKILQSSCYAGMFSGCTSLTEAPQLPAKILGSSCYAGMFSGCTALTVPPVLPATNLQMYCYNMMFKDCTSLKALPVLPATNLANGCYASMFSGCSSLVVNASGPGRKWKIPAESTTASQWGDDMFGDTGGTVLTPELNRTYYIASASPTFSLTVQEIAHTTYRVYTNDTVEVFAPYVLCWGDEIKVVYTADAGYGFRNVAAAAVTFEANVSEMRVPEELLPDAPEPMLSAVEYVDADGEMKTIDALLLTNGSRSTWYAGWYVVTNEVSFEAGVRCEGVVNLILADGAKLTASGSEFKAGVEVDGRSGSFAAYGQKEGTGELDARGGLNAAGIGGNANGEGSNITINGGVVKATGGGQGAGIGGGSHGRGSNITINGGTVTATCGGYGGAGIGGGSYGAGANITINGGIVTATGGEDGAGIGGGTEAAGTDITINGGVVTATGDYGSAGIGGGYYAPGANIFINGGTVTATGGVNGSGIGAGEASMTAASGIFAAVGVTVRAGASENPADVIPHASGTTDIADALAYKRYVTAVGAAPAPTEFTVNGDAVSLGSGAGWTYDAGTKVLTLDGTAPVGAYALSGTKLDNSVSVDVSPATECRVTLTGVALGGPGATRNIVQVTKGTVCLDVAGAVTFRPSNGHKAIGVSAGATLRFTGSGTVDGWSVDVADGGRLVLEGIENVTFASEADAAAAAQYVPATRPNADVEKVVSAEDYAKMFTGAAVPSGTPGLWRVGHELTASVTNEIQQALAAAETLGGLVGTVTSDAPRTTVQTKAGLYYGMAGAAELGDLGAADVPAGKWTLGVGAVREVTGEKPVGAAGSAFYRLKVTAEP